MLAGTQITLLRSHNIIFDGIIAVAIKQYNISFNFSIENIFYQIVWRVYKVCTNIVSRVY